MYRTTINPAGNLTIATSSSSLWIADNPAHIDLSFPPGIQTGQITLETALPSRQNFSMEDRVLRCFIWATLAPILLNVASVQKSYPGQNMENKTT